MLFRIDGALEAGRESDCLIEGALLPLIEGALDGAWDGAFEGAFDGAFEGA